MSEELELKVKVTAEPVVWADEATPFTGPEVLALLRENQRLRDALEKIEGGEGCSTPSYGDCCDMACARVARDALKAPAATEPNGAAQKETTQK